MAMSNEQRDLLQNHQAEFKPADPLMVYLDPIMGTLDKRLLKLQELVILGVNGEKEHYHLVLDRGPGRGGEDDVNHPCSGGTVTYYCQSLLSDEHKHMLNMISEVDIGEIARNNDKYPEVKSPTEGLTNFDPMMFIQQEGKAKESAGNPVAEKMQVDVKPPEKPKENVLEERPQHGSGSWLAAMFHTPDEEEFFEAEYGGIDPIFHTFHRDEWQELMEETPVPDYRDKFLSVDSENVRMDRYSSGPSRGVQYAAGSPSSVQFGANKSPSYC